MTARYRMERNPDSGKNGNKMPLHPRLIPYETVSIKKLMKYAKSRSTYSEADIAGALQLITDLVTERLREGDNVEIEGLGFFSVSLQSRAVMSKTELRICPFQECQFPMLPAVEEGLEDDAAHAYEKFRSLCTRHGGPGGTSLPLSGRELLYHRPFLPLSYRAV